MSDRVARMLIVLVGASLLPISAAGQTAGKNPGKIPRTAGGRPDLSGTYDIATLTPLQRSKKFGNKQFLNPEEAAAIEKAEAELTHTLSLPSDPNRGAPPEGGDDAAARELGTLTGAAGRVGGYNWFWVDRGTETFELEGRRRTSIIVDPPDGRRPPMTPAARERASRLGRLYKEDLGDNRGVAWWVDVERPGPYDGPEMRPLAERCLLGFGSSAGPPALPVLYNNLKRIVQTPNYLMILNEMVHDARIIRLNSEHAPQEIRKWMGDSVGHWEGDTLVVDTTNFGKRPALRSASENLHVVERFTRLDENTLLYQFTVEDPTVWTSPWSGEYPWSATDQQVYEYACHEANYSLEGILKGARLLEAEAAQKSTGEPQ